ncbi:MAG: ThiF family adenylyltransferase [Solirubrobacterales bacterium]
MSDPRLRVIQRGEGSEEQVLRILEETTIAVRLNAGQPSPSHQLLALCLVDLLTRVFARIQIEVDPVAHSNSRLPDGPSLLVERFAALRSNGTAPSDPGNPSITIAIGPEVAGDINLDGNGWQSYLGTDPSRLPPADEDSEAVPIGPLLAAARGAAHAFNLAMAPLGRPAQLPSSLYSSALDYRIGVEPLSIPELPKSFRIDALQVGAGSLGGALDYALARCGSLGGELAIIDPQRLEAENAYRALLAPRPIAEAEEGKAAVAARELAAAGLDAMGECVDVQGWLAGREREAPLPLVLCAVDSAASRRTIQDCLPLDLLNGACNENEATVSFHRTGHGPCVYCLHLPAMMDQAAVKSRRIVDATGIPYEAVIELLTTRAPLEPDHLRFVEREAGLQHEALDDYRGATLEQLYDREFRYGAVQLESGEGGIISVASPWVTALAGFLLAAETLKRSSGQPYELYRLGLGGALGVKVEESVYASPEHILITDPERWPDNGCLCRSPRRRGLIVTRYGLSEADYEL